MLGEDDTAAIGRVPGGESPREGAPGHRADGYDLLGQKPGPHAV